MSKEFSFTLTFTNRINDLRAICMATNLSLDDAQKLQAKLHNLWNPTTPEKLQRDERFILTGSRFFQPTERINPLTDWDFFANADKINSTELADLGFAHVTTPEDYRDAYLRAVYYNQQSNIHVQLYKSRAFEAKLRAQDFIKANCLHGSIDKRFQSRASISRVWTNLINHFMRESE